MDFTNRAAVAAVGRGAAVVAFLLSLHIIFALNLLYFQTKKNVLN